MFEGKVASQSDSLAAGIDVKATGGGDQIFMSGKQSFTANNCANCKITKIGGFEESRQLRESLGLSHMIDCNFHAHVHAKTDTQILKNVRSCFVPCKHTHN